eukprot:COSAG01_NODE_5366_length_4307_cov_2.475998_5_plen_26_part_01
MAQLTAGHHLLFTDLCTLHTLSQTQK